MSHNNNWKVIVNITLLMVSVLSLWMYYATAKQMDDLSVHALGAKYGCSYITHPFPLTIEGVTGLMCGSENNCPNFIYRNDPRCEVGVVIQHEFLKEKLRNDRRISSLASEQDINAGIGGISTYLFVGWHLYSLLFAIFQRFLTLKWASLLSLASSICTLNAVGVGRSIVAILNLPNME